MRPLNDFVRLALNKGPYGAGQNNAEEAVRQTAIDFCERTGVWKHEAEFTLQIGVPDYPIDVPADTRLVCIDTVEIGPQKYRTQRNSLICRCGGWSVSVPDDKTVWISPTPFPVCETWVKLHLWCAPLMECCEFPDNLWQEYSETVAYGAASRLLQQPKQDYTNQGLAERCRNLYEAGVTRAKNKQMMERTRGPILMRGGYF